MLVYEDACLPPRAYDYVIVAATLRSMQLTMNLDGATTPVGMPADVEAPFAEQDRLRQAIRTPHIVSSSKLFGFLPQKPWICPGNQWPRTPEGEVAKVVLTDTLARQMYFLDPYPEDPCAGLAVLISYNWGDDAIKHMAIPSDAGLKRAYEVALETAHASGDVVAASVGRIPDYMLAVVDWQLEPMIFGGFKLDYPEQYRHTTQVVYQYQRAGERVFLANNNCSYQGGWIEGAMQSGMNAAAAVLRGLGAQLREDVEGLFAPNPFQGAVDVVELRYAK
ncbi:MAG: FAD-dependent oxidoreductase [Deltaproteobacteria bacterium]|nr:FAD-dependent oxidoreductase [Deltaproteobacteria bacterium]